MPDKPRPSKEVESMNSATTRPKVDIRTRRRELLIEDAQRVALDLFLEKGYENTSIEEISTHLGVSQRTLFRHVESKDSFIHAILAEWSNILNGALPPQGPTVGLTGAYLKAVRVLCEHLEQEVDRSKRIVMLIYSQPVTQSSHWATHTSFADPRMSEQIARRLGIALDRPEVTIFRSMLMTCVVQGLYEWATGTEDHPLYELLHRNLRLVRPVEDEIRRESQPDTARTVS
jgi:TetR/AcrR family transcriptional regulator, regulator of mycofactocin system